jgi:hypothetical protein
MNTVHKIVNGEGIVMGWAVVENRETMVGTFKTVEEACKVAGEKDNSLAALKTLKVYNTTAVSYVMKETGFASELEAAMSLYLCDWDVDRAVERCLFTK